MLDNILLKNWKTKPKQNLIKHNYNHKTDINIDFKNKNNTNIHINLDAFNINNFMKTKFDLLYENILQGMSPDEKEELGVSSELENSDVETADSDFEDEGSDTITLKLSKSAFDELKAALDNVEVEDEDEDDDDDDESEDFSEEDFTEEDSSEDEDNEVAEDSTFGEGIETEEVSEEKGKKLMNKASNKVGGKIVAKGGTAQKGKIPEPKADPEELSSEKGKKLMNKASNKVGGSVTGSAGKALF